MLHEALAWWNYWWDQLLNHYRVNPFLFVAMYSVKSVIYWWTVFLIVKCARRRQWERLPGLILLNVTTNVSPWVYVYFFGTNLPWWYPWMMWWMAGWGIVYLVLELRKRLHQLPGPEPVLRRRRRHDPPPACEERPAG